MFIGLKACGSRLCNPVGIAGEAEYSLLQKENMRKLINGKNATRFPFWRERADHLLRRWGGKSRLLYVRTVEKHNNEAFSYRLTKRILLSTI